LYVNQGYWYWLSMRLKLPHYNVGEQFIDAMAERFMFSLMALDKIGKQFYLGTDNDTMTNTLYHFNYFSVLITGIFDNIALEINKKLKTNLPEWKVNLKNPVLLKEIEKENKFLRQHIDDFMPFIKLINGIRNLVVHRQGLPDSRFEYPGENWKANFVEVNAEIQSYLKNCKDVKTDFDPFTELGFFHSGETFLEPFHFVLTVEKKLTVFIDKYLEILGYPSFIELAKVSGDDFANTLIQFEKGHLGF